MLLGYHAVPGRALAPGSLKTGALLPTLVTSSSGLPLTIGVVNHTLANGTQVLQFIGESSNATALSPQPIRTCGGASLFAIDHVLVPVPRELLQSPEPASPSGEHVNMNATQLAASQAQGSLSPRPTSSSPVGSAATSLSPTNGSLLLAPGELSRSLQPQIQPVRLQGPGGGAGAVPAAEVHELRAQVNTTSHIATQGAAVNVVARAVSVAPQPEPELRGGEEPEAAEGPMGGPEPAAELEEGPASPGPSPSPSLEEMVRHTTGRLLGTIGGPAPQSERVGG